MFKKKWEIAMHRNSDLEIETFSRWLAIGFSSVIVPGLWFYVWIFQKG